MKATHFYLVEDQQWPENWDRRAHFTRPTFPRISHTFRWCVSATHCGARHFPHRFISTMLHAPFTIQQKRARHASSFQWELEINNKIYTKYRYENGWLNKRATFIQFKCTNLHSNLIYSANIWHQKFNTSRDWIHGFNLFSFRICQINSCSAW